MNNTLSLFIVWTSTTQVPTGKAFAADLGHRPQMRKAVQAHAALWCSMESAEDLAGAERYCVRESRSKGEGESDRRVVRAETADAARRMVLR